MFPRKLSRLIAILAFAGTSLASNAGESVFNFRQVFPGNPSPGMGGTLAGTGATTPWFTATFTDLAANTVQLTVAAPGLAVQQTISKLWFNLQTLNPTSLTFTPVSGPTATISLGENHFNASSGGFYDIKLSYDAKLTLPNGNPNPNAFTNTQTSKYIITGPAGLTSNSFSDLASPTGVGGKGNASFGPFVAAGGVRLGNTMQGVFVSATAPVPEPEIFAMMLAGLGLVGYVARRRRRVEDNAA